MAQQNKRKDERRGTYDQRKALVCSLIDDCFITYDNIDYDIFINNIDNRNDFNQNEWDIISVCTVLSEESYNINFEPSYNDVEFDNSN